MENIIDRGQIGITGIHTITICDATKKIVRDISGLLETIRFKREVLLKQTFSEKIENALKQLHEEYCWLKRELFRFKKREEVIKNVTVTAGRTVIARRLSGNTTYTGIVNYTALGTNNAAPVVGNTQLGTETYRKALSSGTYLSNVAYLETFFTASETSGTFEEYGMFIDGTGAANSGQLFNRFTSTNAKSVTETMNVQSVITMSDV